MILGIVGLVFIGVPVVGLLSIACGILAVVLGISALAPINRGERWGKGMAIAGIVTGIVTLALFLLLILAFASFFQWVWVF
jgi:hypothetical protein